MTPKAHRLTALFQKLAHTPSRKRRRALCIALRNEAARLFAPGPTPRTVAVRISTTNPKRNP